MESSIMDPVRKALAINYFGSKRLFEIYVTIRCLKAIRKHNAESLPENRLSGACLVEAEERLARFEHDYPDKYRELSSLCD